jgi:hypothetical protein
LQSCIIVINSKKGYFRKTPEITWNARGGDGRNCMTHAAISSTTGNTNSSVHLISMEE